MTLTPDFPVSTRPPESNFRPPTDASRPGAARMVATPGTGTRTPSIGIVSTFPPTACGLATFASALGSGLERIGVAEVGVVRVGTDTPSADRRVVLDWRPGSPRATAEAARVLDGFDVVVLQHEYGIFGGCDGEEVLDLLGLVQAPVVTTLHTVPLSPSIHQQEILEAICRSSDAVVTMTRAAGRRLLAHYRVDERRVHSIPHGATMLPVEAPPSRDEPLVITWGLIGPGKGIEWVIDALPLMRDLGVPFRYLVAGRTHPKVLERDGETYRWSLMDRAAANGVADLVQFDDEYRSLPDLMEMISRATCVILPYDSSDQITSGVLVDAVTAGRPVVSTPFPHAAELLSTGAGLLVPHRNPVAIASALRRIITSPTLTRAMAERSRELARTHAWPTVAEQYLQLAESLVATSHAREIAV